MGMKYCNVYAKLVKFLGGQLNTAEALGVTQAAVSHWVSGRNKMGAYPAIRAEEATNGRFKANRLCPDLNKFRA